MTDDEPVGYGRPPRKHQFQVGNKAASKSHRRGTKKGNALELPELIDRALRAKRKIKRGNQVYSLSVAEILSERLVQMITSGTARDVAQVMQMIERYLPGALTRTTEVLEIIHHRAEASNIALPPDDLWEEGKP